MAEVNALVAELRLAVTRDQYCSGTTISHRTAVGLLDLIAHQAARLEEKDALIERLKLEAQIHAGEARCHKSTVHEAYQTCTGATGEPGNWHGAEPIKTALAEAKAARTAAEAEKERYRAALERIARWEKHGGETPRVYPVDIARAALAHPAPKPAGEAPAGWKLVPVDPTEEMLCAWHDARPASAVEAEDGGWIANSLDWDHARYEALLAASPAPANAAPASVVSHEPPKRETQQGLRVTHETQAPASEREGA